MIGLTRRTCWLVMAAACFFEKGVFWIGDTMKNSPALLAVMALFGTLLLCGGCSTRILDIVMVDGVTGARLQDASIDKEEYFLLTAPSVQYSERVSKIYVYPDSDGVFHVAVPTTGKQYFVIFSAPGHMMALGNGAWGSLDFRTPSDINTTDPEKLNEKWLHPVEIAAILEKHGDQLSPPIMTANVDKMIVIPLYWRATTRATSEKGP